MYRILIIEDDPALVKGLSSVLIEEKHEVQTATNGTDGYNLALHGKHDLIILDLVLPGKDGLAVCRDLRAQNIRIPILMLTSRTEDVDKILGLEIGADDYVTKPFNVRELTARIKALLRRSEMIREHHEEEYNFGNIQVNFRTQEILKNGDLLQLSVKEYQILKYFIEHEGEVITREQFLNKVWGYSRYPTTRTVDNYILSLRKKIETEPSSPQHILTVPTAGYKFHP